MTEIVTLKVRVSRRQGVPFSTLPSSLVTSHEATVLRARLIRASNHGHVGEHRLRHGAVARSARYSV